MKDAEFYEHLLGLKTPWTVEAVKLDTGSKSVEVKVGYEAGTLWASEAGERLPVYDHVERNWRHLDTCGFETRLVCRVPRVQTPEGKVETVPVPWAGKGSRFTLLYERFAIEVLLACRSVSAAAELLGLSWDELQTIMERAVQRGLARRELAGLRHVGMDEKSFGRGQSYGSLLTDLDRARVLEVTQDNDREAAELLLATLPAEVRAALEAVCIDMSGHFAAAARAGLPEAALVHDRFHISAHLNDAVAAVHREENRRLQKLSRRAAQGDAAALWVRSGQAGRGAGGEICGTQRLGLKECAGLGNQGSFPALLVLPLRRQRAEVLPSMVWLGEPQPAPADDQSGEDAQAAL